MNIREMLCVLAVGSLVVSVSGCASDSDDADTGDDQNVTASTPLTLKNWINHPKIKAVREEVGDVTTGASKMKKRDNATAGCDSFTSKFTDADGHIRKVNFIVKEGGDAEFTEEAFYRTNGKLLFIFTTDGDSKTVSENRVYYDVNGKPFWQVFREGPRNKIAKVAETKPNADDAFMASIEQKANDNFNDNGCFEGEGD